MLILFVSMLATPASILRSHVALELGSLAGIGSAFACSGLGRWLQLDDPPLQCECHGVDPVIDAKLGKDAFDFALDRILGDA